MPKKIDNERVFGENADLEGVCYRGAGRGGFDFLVRREEVKLVEQGKRRTPLTVYKVLDEINSHYLVRRVTNAQTRSEIADLALFG